MTIRQRQEHERWLVSQFLRHKGLRARRLTSVTGAPGPDVRVTLGCHGQERIVGIEVTEYQCDRKEHGSPRRALAAFANDVLTDVRRHYGWRYSELLGLDIQVKFREERPSSLKSIVVARELTSFLRTRVASIDGPRLFCSTSHRDRAGEFHEFPSLEAAIDHVLVCRLDGSEPPLWHSQDAASTALLPATLAEIIKAKAGKRIHYDLRDLDECWLLICATGETMCDSAGRERFQKSKVRTPEVEAACSHAGFDMVLFWEATSNWSVTILPNSPSARPTAAPAREVS